MNNNTEGLVGAMFRISIEEDGLDHFDKRTLVQQHESVARTSAHLRGGRFHTSSFSLAEPSLAASTPVALHDLIPIRLAELNVNNIHYGRVLFGTLCVKPFKINAIMTVLEDDQGRAVRVGIYNEPPSASTPSALRAKYPKGAKVAIKEPYFKHTLSGSLAVRVDNPSNIERMPDVDASGGINSSILTSTDPSRKGRRNRLLAISNRAETQFEMGEFERALELCNEALEVDPEHVKTIFLKGRALHVLKLYDQACEVLQAADELSFGAADHIKDTLRRSKEAYARSQRREYDISEFLLGAQPPPEVEDFVGDVEIKKTRGRRGRGLFATRDIGVGEILVVSNAAVVVNGETGGLMKSHEIKASLQEDLVAAVSDAARKSLKLRRQLYELDDGSVQVRSSLPTMELFHSGSKDLRDVVPERIRGIVSRNSFGGESLPEDAESLGFSGLWVMPSFINHSCLPNASRLYVGKAMFLHAAKPIKKREEITMSYFDTLLPQPQRQAICEVWDFKCNCKRCALEKSLNTVLESVNAQFEGLQYDAREEARAARTSENNFTTELPKSAEFGQVFEKMEQILGKQPRMKEEEKKWVRASYASAYWARMQSDKLFGNTVVNEIVKCIVSTVPGDFRALVMVAQLLESLKQQSCNEGCVVEECAALAAYICLRVFGKQSEHVTQSLISRYAKSTLF